MLPRQHLRERDYSYDSENQAYFITGMGICLKMKKENMLENEWTAL